MAEDGSESRSARSTIATQSLLKLSGDLIPLEAELRERLRKDFDRGTSRSRRGGPRLRSGTRVSPWIWNGLRCRAQFGPAAGAGNSG